MPQVERDLAGRDHVVQSTNEARAGQTGDKVRYVWVFGLLGVIVLFAAVYFYFFA